MLLFVRNPYYAAICDGTKRYEMRAGPRYRNIKVGDQLSINGRFRVTVSKVQVFERPEEAARASQAAGYLASVAAIRACYPRLAPGDPLYMFHFDAPRRGAKLSGLTKLLTIALDKLVALRRNPQYLTEAQMEGLKTSITRDGFLAPIVVRKRPKDTFEILSGNHRVMACRELGHKDIACVLIHPCSDAQAARIAMNMNTVHGDPNVELIAPFLSTLDDITLKEIYLPDSMLAEIKSFDATLKERLAGLQIPDALDNKSNVAIPNCKCKTCGRIHVALTS